MTCYSGLVAGWVGLKKVRACSVPKTVGAGACDRATRGLTSCIYEGTAPPALGPSGVSVSSHRMRVRKASQRLVSFRACNTEETNQRFRQSKANVPSSNQWIITQPTSRLPFRLLAVECEAAAAPPTWTQPRARFPTGPRGLGSARCSCHPSLIIYSCSP
jgi:hypothetical protein